VAGRETEVVDMILKGPETATQLKLKEYLQAGDTVERRTNFVFTAFEKQLQVVCGAIRQQDPNHMILGTRFGGDVPDPMLRPPASSTFAASTSMNMSQPNSLRTLTAFRAVPC